MLAGSLELELFANVARLRDDMNKALGLVQRTARGFDDAAAQMRNALGGIGGGLSAAAFGTWIKSAIDFQDQLNDLNKTTDIAVSKLAGISLMSKQTGSDLTGMAQAINKLTLEMGKAPEKFAKIGITAKDPLEAFKQLSEIFRSIEDPQLRAAVAAEALGKGWASAAPALAEGSKAIGDMVTRGEELAGITALDAQMADAFNDSMSELQLALMGTASNLAGDMLPLLTELVKSLTDVTASANNTETPFNILTETLRALIVIGGNVAFVIHGIAVEIGGMAAQAAAFFSGNFSQAKQIGEDMAADAARRRAAFDGWEKSMMTAGTAASSLGNETDALSRRMAANAKATLSAADAARLKAFVDAAAAKKASDETKKLREEEEKFRIAWGRADAIRQGDAVLKRNEEEAKALAKVAEEYADLVEAQDKATTSLASEVRAQREYNQRIGLTTDAIAALDAAKLQEQATAKDRLATLADEIDWTGALGDAYREQAASLRELAQLKSDGAFDQKQIDDFKSVWESVDKTAHDTFVNIFEGGKNAFEKLRDTLKATLLDLLYQMTVRKWVFNIAASVTGSSAGAVSSVGSAAGLLGGGGGGLLGTIQGGADILNTGGIAGMGYGIGNTAGTALANMTGTGIDGLLATNGAFGTAGGALGALGSALPWIGGALAIASLFGGGKRGGPKDTGSYGSGFLGAGFTRDDTQDQFNTGAANIVGGIGGSYAAMTKALGINAGDLQSGAMFAIDNKGEGDALTQLMTQTYLNGKLVYDRNDANGGGNYEDVGRTPEELQAAISQASARAVLSALKASELPDQLAGYFDTLDPLAMSAEQITAALDLAKAAQSFTHQLGFMGEGLSNLAGLSVKATTELAAAAGGMDQLQGKFAAYYQAFYSEEERAAAALASVTDAMAGLGYSSVDTISEFRDLVESINPVDDASRTLLATLLNLAPAFAAAHAEAKSVSDATKDAREGLRGLVDGLKSLSASVASAEADIASLALQNQIDAANAANAVAEKFGNLSKSLRDFVNGETLQPSALFGDLLKKALGGDAEAMQALPGAAASAIEFAGGRATNAVDFARERAITLRGVREAAEVSALLAAKTVAVPVAEDPMAVAIKNLGIAIGNLQIGIAQSIGVDLSQKLGEIDANLSGGVDLTEFGSYFSGLASDSVLTKIFNEFDSDGSGFISRLEAIKANTASFASAIAKDPLLLGRMQFDFDKWFKESNIGDSATIGPGGPSVTKTGAGSATLVSDSGTTKITTGSSIVDLAASDPSLSAAWETQYGPSLTVATAELERAAKDARAWISSATPGSQIPWMGGSLSTNGSVASWFRSNGTVVQINPQSGGDIRALAESYPEMLSGWRSQGYKFATGGAFSNGIVTRPTDFSLGQMGEAGPEAIMPLTNIGGSLGVRVTGNNGNDALVAELRALREEVGGLRAEARATASNTNKTAKILGRVTQDGESITTTVLA